jgi:uncharacterized membrane protein (UPF0127 family)
MIKRAIKIFIFLLTIGLIYFLVASIATKDTYSSLKEYDVVNTQVLGNDVKLYVANTNSKIVKGLSKVEKLEENEGMIFMYPDEGERIFWMKDMNFPLDILWLNSKGELVHKEENVLPENYPETYGSGIIAQYVMEFNAGFIEKNEINKL